MILSVEKVVKEYDGVRALNGLSLNVEKGTIKGLIGPNGSGKTTLFHLISGVERPTSGRIFFKGVDITYLPPHKISALGLGRTFQTIQTFGNMYVVDNIMAGMHLRLKGGFLSSGLWLPRIGRAEREALKRGKEILEFLGLLGRWEWNASQLSYGEQRLLEFGRALAMKPDLLLLDEPGAGLTPVEIGQLSEKILKLKQEGITIFLIEHHMGMVMEIADEVAVLHNGELIAEGSPESIREDPKVTKVYLGGENPSA